MKDEMMKGNEKCDPISLGWQLYENLTNSVIMSGLF
jgi:hypothetical protein